MLHHNIYYNEKWKKKKTFFAVPLVALKEMLLKVYEFIIFVFRKNFETDKFLYSTSFFIYNLYILKILVYIFICSFFCFIFFPIWVCFQSIIGRWLLGFLFSMRRFLEENKPSIFFIESSFANSWVFVKYCYRCRMYIIMGEM